MPGVVVAGVEVGGLSESELEDRLGQIENEMRSSSIVVRRAGTGSEKSFSANGADLGYEIDVEATLEAAMDRGRQSNPAAALSDHVLALFREVTVELYEDIDGRAMSAWLADAGEALTDPPQEGDIRVVGTDVEPVYPSPGIGVDQYALRTSGLEAVRQRGETVEVPAVDALPRTDDDAVDLVVRRAQDALAAPIVLERDGLEVTIEPEQLATLLDTKVVASSEPARLRLIVSPKRLHAELGDVFAPLESEPEDATFAVAGDGVDVVPSESGFVVDPQRTARQIIVLATGGGTRVGPLRSKKVEAEFTTEDARALGVREQVSSFTTYHACCEPRVENIHRAADVLDRTIVEPGDTFSLNEVLGPRTTEKGYVGAPAISDGEFVEQVGGGISQLATTTFNAIFFGGYDFIEYKAHSYYISRYPVGREATVSTPAPDLAFINDSDAGIFIDTYYSDTSITVSFYGFQEVEVESFTGERTNVEKPEEECEVNKDLGRDEEVVIQEGLEGFDIVVERVFTYPDGDTETEEFHTHYAAMPRIVERSDCSDRNDRAGRDEPKDEEDP